MADDNILALWVRSTSAAVRLLLTTTTAAATVTTATGDNTGHVDVAPQPTMTLRTGRFSLYLSLHEATLNSAC